MTDQTFLFPGLVRNRSTELYNWANITPTFSIVHTYIAWKFCFQPDHEITAIFKAIDTTSNERIRGIGEC